MAEIGVLFGMFSRFLIDQLQPSRFDAYDIFKAHEMEFHGPHRTQDHFKGATHRAFYEDKFADEIRAGRMAVHEGDSSSALLRQPDASYDLIYIDGDHSIDGARKDAEAAARKIKPSGMLIFNDYIMLSQTRGKVTNYGVVQAANDLMVNHGWRMHGFALQGAMYCDVALVRR